MARSSSSSSSTSSSFVAFDELESEEVAPTAPRKPRATRLDQQRNVTAAHNAEETTDEIEEFKTEVNISSSSISTAAKAVYGKLPLKRAREQQQDPEASIGKRAALDLKLKNDQPPPPLTTSSSSSSSNKQTMQMDEDVSANLSQASDVSERNAGYKKISIIQDPIKVYAPTSNSYDDDETDKPDTF